MAGAPVTKWELYDTAYTERYMGTPRSMRRPTSRRTRSPCVKIGDPLLLVHGMSDDNVLFENSDRLIAEVQQANGRSR